MSDEIGFVAVLPQDGEASALQGLTEVSEHTRQRVDAEVKRIVGETHDEAIRLLPSTGSVSTRSPRRWCGRRRSTSRRRTRRPA